MTELVTVEGYLETGLNFLLYGPQGAGKTLLASTAQDHAAMKDVLFLDIEGGLITIAGRGDILHETVRTTDDLEQAFWKLHNKSYAPWKSVRTVVIDSISELQGINLEEIVKANAGRRGGNLNDTQLQDYKVSTTHLKRLLRWYKNLPYNVIVTALMHKAYPPGEVAAPDPIEIRPMITQKLAESLMGFMDFVWFLYSTDRKVEKGTVKEYFMLTESVGITRAKTRGPQFAKALGGRVQNPSLPKLYDLFVQTESPRK